MPDLLDSHKMRVFNTSKGGFRLVVGGLTTFRDTLEEWKNDTTIEKLESANKTLAMDVKVYKRRYEGEIAS